MLTHLTDRRYLPVLERVFLRDGTESDLEEGDDAVERPEDEEHVCMYAIVPESCAPARIGLDKWLSVHERFPEVSCHFLYYRKFGLGDPTLPRVDKSVTKTNFFVCRISNENH